MSPFQLPVLAPPPLDSARAGLLAKRGRGDVPPLSATHEHSPGKGLAESGGGRGCQAPLPAGCDELIHQLSRQGIRVLGGRALGLQGQADLLQAGLLGAGGRERRPSVQGGGGQCTQP